MTAHAPSMPTCEQIREDLGAYALGILESDEHATVREHLEGCPDCRAVLASFDDVVDALATAPAPIAPPPALRARLLADIQTAPPIRTSDPVQLSRPRRSPTIVSFPRWAVWPVAAAALLLLVGIATLTYLFVDARDQRDDARTSTAQLAAYLSAGGQITKLLDATNDGKYYGHGTLVTAPNHPPLVIVGGCSPSAEDRVYRVWVAQGENRTRIGELKVGKDGDGWIEVNLSEPLENFDAIGVTMITGGDERRDVLVAEVANSVAT